jgi:bile acid:Na+ symporter, BASS family
MGMGMTLGRVLNLLALVTLIEGMIFVGLAASTNDLINAARDWKLIVRMLLANYLFVPAVAVALLMIFHTNPTVAVGFLILAACPGGPYGSIFTMIAKANVGAATGLGLILVGLSPLVSPGLLNILVSILLGNQVVHVNVTKMTVTLILSQLLPLLFGLAVNYWRPSLTSSLVGPARQGAKILNATLLVLIFYTYYRLFLRIKPIGYFGMLILLIATVVIGWLAGVSDSQNRKAMALTTSIRNSVPSMVIAIESFDGTLALPAVVVFGIFGTLGSLVLALWWGMKARALGRTVEVEGAES